MFSLCMYASTFFNTCIFQTWADLLMCFMLQKMSSTCVNYKPYISHFTGNPLKNNIKKLNFEARDPEVQKSSDISGLIWRRQLWTQIQNKCRTKMLKSLQIVHLENQKCKTAACMPRETRLFQTSASLSQILWICLPVSHSSKILIKKKKKVALRFILNA